MLFKIFPGNEKQSPRFSCRLAFLETLRLENATKSLGQNYPDILRPATFVKFLGAALPVIGKPIHQFEVHQLIPSKNTSCNINIGCSTEDSSYSSSPIHRH